MSKSQIIPEPQTTNLIGIGTQITGDFITKGDLRIDGCLKGNLHSEGKVIVGDSGKIEGELKCKSADILGEVTANIEVAELLNLRATAVISGDIKTSKISIEAGAVFTGACTMITN